MKSDCSTHSLLFNELFVYWPLVTDPHLLNATLTLSIQCATKILYECPNLLTCKVYYPTSHIFLKEVKKFRVGFHNNLFLEEVPDQYHIEHVRTNNQNNKITK